MFDLVLTIPFLILTSPLVAAIWLCARVRLGKPVLFRQVRPGYLEKPFTIYKFRTMRNTTDAEGRLLPDAERMDGFGSFLRKTSLDELPELWNVLRGELSLVGPRPLLPEYLPLYTAEQHRRHEVKPGVTGWAQVHGRNAIGWEEKFKLDLWYVENRSFWVDIRILFLTVRKVFQGEDTNSAGHVTMPRFEGSQNSRGGAGSENTIYRAQ
ncbi:MAG: sugar transferase [Terriglobia bacterium]